MSLITLIIAVFLANGQPIVNTFTVPDETHCTPQRAQQYIEYFVLPTLAPGQQIQKRFRSMCLQTAGVEPSDDLVPLPAEPEDAVEPFHLQRDA